jgi:hypothetical protein
MTKGLWESTQSLAYQSLSSTVTRDFDCKPLRLASAALIDAAFSVGARAQGSQ